MSRRVFGLWLLALSFSIAWILWPDRMERKEGSLALVASLQGNVSIRPAGSFSWTSARIGSPLRAFDAIATGPKSRVKLRLDNGATIVLPEDTQIKLQAQSIIPGMTIALIKGGLEVQAEGVLAEEVSSVDKKAKAARPAATVAASRPITIQTNRYSVDLSRLEGQFRLNANAGVEASQPETIRVQTNQGAVTLSQLGEGSALNLGQQLDEILAAAPELPVQDLKPTSPPKPSPPAPIPVKKMEIVPEPLEIPAPAPAPDSDMEQMDETPAPETMPLIDEEPDSGRT